MPILDVKARQIYNSKGFPTIEVEVTTKRGSFFAEVPSGVSIGKHEVYECKDRHRPDHWHGQGVTKAVAMINNVIAPNFTGKAKFDERNQYQIDQLLLKIDGFENKNKLGSNSLMAVSVAVLRAGAKRRGIQTYKHIGDLAGNSNFILPTPFVTCISGGEHTGNNLSFEEFYIAPTGATSFKEAMRMCMEVYHQLKIILKGKFGDRGKLVSDEGGLSCNLLNAEEAIDLIQDAIHKSGYTKRVEIALNMSASKFYKKDCEKYDLHYKEPKSEPGLFQNGDQLLDMYLDLIGKHRIISVTDPFYQDNWNDWSRLKASSPDLQIVGDDLTVSNYRRVKIAEQHDAINCVSLKLNQIGTISELLDTYRQARQAGWAVLVSDRATDTTDVFAAELAIGLGAGQAKFGGMSGSEHLAKYNYILRIEERMGNSAKYAGTKFHNTALSASGSFSRKSFIDY